MTKPLIAALLLALAPQTAHAQDRVFDLHVHLWEGEKSIREYRAQLKADKQPITRFGGILMAPRGQVAETRRKNDELIALAKTHPDLLPIASVHPYDGQAANGELKRLAGLGVKAIKLHPHTQKFDAADPRVLALCTLAGTLGIVVVMDNANIVPGDSEELFNLAVGAPKTKFVFTHMGGLNFRFWNILALARTTKDFFFDNIYFDISATVTIAADSPIEDEFIWTMRNVGIDRVLIGSDYPQISLAKAMGALEKLDLNRADKDRILWGNAAVLFGVEGR